MGSGKGGAVGQGDWEWRLAGQCGRPTPSNLGTPAPWTVRSLCDPVILSPTWALQTEGRPHLWQSCQIHAWRPFLGRKSDWPLLWIWEEKRSSRRWPVVGLVWAAEAERQFSSMAHWSMNMGRSSR